MAVSATPSNVSSALPEEPKATATESQSKVLATAPEPLSNQAKVIEKATVPATNAQSTVQPIREDRKPASASETRSKPALVKGKVATAPRKEERKLNIPPILLEGDFAPAPKVTGPGTRYALGALTPLAPSPNVAARTDLPEGYGTQRLFLTARDPRWLYASWDLTAEQQREYNRRSRHGHLILRIYANEQVAEPVVPEVHVNPESRTFFINVPFPETRYRAELGFHGKNGTWEKISISQSTFTPPDAPSKEVVTEFATIPAQVSFEKVVETVQQFVTEHRPLLEAVAAAQEAQREEDPAAKVSIPEPPLAVPAHPGLSLAVPPPNAGQQNSQHEAARIQSSPREVFERHSPPGVPERNGGSEPKKDKPGSRHRRVEIPVRVERVEPWTPQKRAALARLINVDSYRRVWMGSIEITELVRRQLQELQEDVSSLAAAELARAGEFAPGEGPRPPAISSPAGGEYPRDRKFWFKVNAELILYGSTEPDAKVTIADRVIKLRPDGTFSFRFALPDGRYDLPASASSADGVETRQALLEFSRTTEYRGHVERHPQDPNLRPPKPENL